MRPEYLARWFGWSSGAWSAIVSLLLAVVVWQLWTGQKYHGDRRAFLATVAIFILPYSRSGGQFLPQPGAAIAAAQDSSLQFLLVGVVVLISMILAYTAFSYWVFRSKVWLGDGFH